MTRIFPFHPHLIMTSDLKWGPKNHSPVKPFLGMEGQTPQRNTKRVNHVNIRNYWTSRNTTNTVKRQRTNQEKQFQQLTLETSPAHQDNWQIIPDREFLHFLPPRAGGGWKEPPGGHRAWDTQKCSVQAVCSLREGVSEWTLKPAD